MSEKDRLMRALLVLRNSLAEAVEGLNEILKEVPQQPPSPPALGEEGIFLDYRTKQLVEKGKAGWFYNPLEFPDVEAPEWIVTLARALTEKPGQEISRGEYTYRLSKDGRFINRAPIRRGG